MPWQILEKRAALKGQREKEVNFMERTIIVIFFISFALCGCSANDIKYSSEETITENFSTVIQEETNSEYDISTEEAASEVPFLVVIDKEALETGLADQTTVIIDTELTDWEYSVKADYGDILNLNKSCFDYIRPKDNKKYEDTITVFFADKENKRTYKTIIPLNFPASSDNILPKIE